MFRSLLPRHYFAIALLLVLLAAFGFYFLYERSYRQSFSKTFDDAFTAATQPQSILKLPADLVVDLGQFPGQRKLAYSVWVRKRDGSQCLFRVVLPPSDQSFWGFNMEVLPGEDPHRAQYPTHFKSIELVAPTVVPTPENWGYEKAVQSGVKIEMKVVSSKFIKDPWFDGPPYGYENLKLHLTLSEKQGEGRPLALPLDYLDRAAFLKNAYLVSPLDNGISNFFILLIFGLGIPGSLFCFLVFVFLLFLLFRWLKAVRCPQCGRPIGYGITFCGKCGNNRKSVRVLENRKDLKH